MPNLLCLIWTYELRKELTVLYRRMGGRTDPNYRKSFAFKNLSDINLELQQGLGQNLYLHFDP